MAALHRSRIPLLCAVVIIAACNQDSSGNASTVADATCDDPVVRSVVERFGERLRSVSLLAPDTAVARQIRLSYAPLVSDSLLTAWMAQPKSAPGRQVSSPWPDRIQIDSVASIGPSECLVTGDLLYASSAEPGPGEVAARESVAIRVKRDAEWRIHAFVRQADQN